MSDQPGERSTSELIAEITSQLAELSAKLAALGVEPATQEPVLGAEPLVLLSGMLGDWSLWDEVLPRLAPLAAVRTARIDLDDSVAELAENVLAESPPKFALAGHSLGGIVALEVVRRAPQRVTRLALLNSSGRAGSEAQQEVWTRLRDRVEAGRFHEVAEELCAANLPAGRRSDPELLDRSRRMAAAVGPEGLLRQLCAQQTRPDALPAAARIQVPTLVVSGELDEVAPRELQLELAQTIPGARHVVLSGVGHMSPLEAPEDVASVLAAWLG